MKETGVFIQWMPLLDQLFNESGQACLWLCGYLKAQVLNDILVEHSNGEVREQFSTVVKTVTRVGARENDPKPCLDLAH